MRSERIGRVRVCWWVGRAKYLQVAFSVQALCSEGHFGSATEVVIDIYSIIYLLTDLLLTINSLKLIL